MLETIERGRLIDAPVFLLLAHGWNLVAAPQPLPRDQQELQLSLWHRDVRFVKFPPSRGTFGPHHTSIGRSSYISHSCSIHWFVAARVAAIARCSSSPFEEKLMRLRIGCCFVVALSCSRTSPRREQTRGGHLSFPFARASKPMRRVVTS